MNGGGLIEQRDMGLWVVVKAAAAVTIAEFVYGGNDDDEVGGGRRMFILGPLERERERESVCLCNEMISKWIIWVDRIVIRRRITIQATVQN